MAPIRAAYEASPEWKEIAITAYPPPEVQKKPKKVRDKGTRFPGPKKEQEQAKNPEAENQEN